MKIIKWYLIRIGILVLLSSLLNNLFGQDYFSISGITSPSAANGIYNYQGMYSGEKYWQNSSGYKVYRDDYGNREYWNIDIDLSDDNGVYFFVEDNTSIPPQSGYTPLDGTGNPSLTFYPEINIQGNSVNIVDGDNSPSLSDHTDFGSANVTSQTVSRTFTIQNTGKAQLSISSVEISGTNSSDFSITSSPSSIVNAESSTTFAVTFNPSTAGDLTAKITVNNNDADESAYDFDVKGFGNTSVTSHTPTKNSLDVIVNNHISVTFSATIDGTTLDDDITFNVDGFLSGEHQGSFSGGGTSTITFNPTNDFEVGEVVAVTLTTGIKSTGGVSLADNYTFQFVVEAPSGNAQFSNSGSVSGSETRGISLGDFDGDGDLDAFVGTSSGNKVWLNNGSGGFTDSEQSLGNSDSKEISIADFDGDGDLDVFVGNYGQANKIWLNGGSGTFTDSGQNLGTSNSRGVSLGDLDGDGDIDAFISNYAQANKVWLNDGSGNFTDNGNSLGTSKSRGCSLGDIDGDGDLDAYVANYGEANKVWLNDGSGNFTDGGQNLGSLNSLGVSMGDLDSDGDIDAFEIVYSDHPNKVWLNDGSGNFTDSGQSLGNSRSHYVSLGDLDGDGDLDAFVTNLDNQANKVWLNNGSGVFTDNGQNLGSSFSACVSLGDLDGDNDLDAFVSNSSNQASIVWLNQGVVPVELTSFNTTVNNDYVILSWQTATEVNNYGFEVQRASTPLSPHSEAERSRSWKTIGFVEGHGNSNSPKDYSFVDDNNSVAGASTPLSNHLSYRLKQIDTDGAFEYFPNAFGIEVEIDLPTEYKLSQNYPNPFNPSTTISYSIPVDTRRGVLSQVTLKIYNILGEEVATLVNEVQATGRYEVKFNASELTSGIYYYRLHASIDSKSNFNEIKKMLLLK